MGKKEEEVDSEMERGSESINLPKEIKKGSESIN